MEKIIKKQLKKLDKKECEETLKMHKTGRKREFAELNTKTVRLPVEYIDFAVKLCDVLSSVEAGEEYLEKILKSIKNETYSRN